MDELKAYDEALNLSMKEAGSRTGSSFSLQKDIESFQRWVTKSGKVWTVARFKHLKTIALNLLAGSELDLTFYHGRKTVYKGVTIPALRLFAALVNAKTSNNWRGIRAVLDVLNVYQVFSGPGDDVAGKIATITERPSSGPAPKNLAIIKARIVQHFPLKKMTRPLAIAFKGPDVGGSRYAMEPRRNSSSLEAIIPAVSNIPAWIWEAVPGMKAWFKDQPYLENVSRYSRAIFAQGNSQPSPYWGGNLAILGESGLKTRIVYVGHPWIQGALKPIMVLLQRQLLKLGTDCTFDQELGREYLRENLIRGNRVHSVDLSAATDNFPFYLQRYVGELVGVPKWALDLMENAGFYDPVHKDNQELMTYGKGQPMGLYPSFCLFALTHNVLLHSIARHLGLDPNLTFRVLGDDVIISNDALKDKYLQYLHILSVPVSQSKSFSSETLGEFAGSVFWKGYDVTPIKWRNVTAQSINVISQYIDRGLVVVDHASQRIRSIPLTDQKVFPIADALYPIPKELGGFGQLTRMKISDRLHWGRRRARSLRTGYLSLFSDRVHRFLSPQELKGIDVSKFAGLVDQQIKFTDLIARAKELALKVPAGHPMPMLMGAPGSQPKADLPSTREGLKGLESLVFSKDSIEERLGKYHAWWIAKLGPNPVREFNRMITMTGEAADSLNVPILTVSDTKALWARVRHLHPSRVEEYYTMALERLELLRGIRQQVASKPESLQKEDGLFLLKLAGSVGVSLINPLVGITALGATIMTKGEREDKPAQLDRLVPLV